MEHRIFRTKQEEYWDIWCEDAIVFPSEKTLQDVFTEENLRKLITSYSDKDEYPTYIIKIVHEGYVDVIIYANGQNADNCTEDIHFEFVEMSKALVISQVADNGIGVYFSCGIINYEQGENLRQCKDLQKMGNQLKQLNIHHVINLVVAGKKVCSTEWKSETLKYPLSSTVATLSHHLFITIEAKCSVGLKKQFLSHATKFDKR